MRSLHSSRHSRAGSVTSALTGQIFTRTGVYKGVPVAVKRLENHAFSPDKTSLKTLKTVSICDGISSCQLLICYTCERFLEFKFQKSI